VKVIVPDADAVVLFVELPPLFWTIAAATVNRWVPAPEMAARLVSVMGLISLHVDGCSVRDLVGVPRLVAAPWR
jgi:hypothetical protein